MDYYIVELEAVQSESACRSITATLPEWFGIPEANERYANGVKERTSFGIYIDDDCVGMITLEFPYANNANIYWMGVKKNAHKLGMGRKLLKFSETYCRDHGCSSITVETLSPKEEDPQYLKTYNFYLKSGFMPLFELQPYGPELLMVYLIKWIDSSKR